jgi:probable phosphoglycerate mutase
MAVTTEVVITRHGEAKCNASGVVGGERGCTGLTTRGLNQMRAVADRLAVEHEQRPFDAFYTTPRLRVRESADVVAARLDMTPTIDTDLRGPDHGDADGQLWHDIKTAFGGPPQHDPDRPYAPGSECWNAYLRRATDALQRILGQHTGGRILIVGHGETIEAVHTLLLGLPTGACLGLGFVTDHACLARWQHHINRFGRAVWMLAAHNDTSHLRDEQQ